VGYDVYVNLPKGSIADPTGNGFVGTLAVFGLKHEHQLQRMNSQSFDITDLVLRQDATADVIVTIVPFDLLTPRRGTTVPMRRSGNVRIEGMAVVIAETSPQ
jgi:hypothetical protein